MKLLLKRRAFRQTYTIGSLFINDVFFSDTLEDHVRDLTVEPKVYGQTAIPTGTYRTIMSFSNRFKRLMPEILNVPGFDGIRIHSGNTDADTNGCILLGKNTEIGKVTNSRQYSDALNNILLTTLEKVYITIT